ncbi:hypothetical protein [Novosphingobium sp.]|uniref:hypothetical protein n=1 Tax=Novosphingobium sp. TaxID=1874826 RepID=UPI00286E8FD8|nr:hypothetical protein [Novosphingobium sp.]
MTRAILVFLPVAVAILAAAPGLATPVFVAESPGHTKFLIDDATVKDVAIGDARVRQVRVLTHNAFDPQMTSGQVGADGIMQFDCGALSYREWSTTSIRKDGARVEVVRPLASRRFVPTREGSFERKLLMVACTMRKTN